MPLLHPTENIHPRDLVVLRHPTAGTITTRLTGTDRFVNLPGTAPIEPLEKFLENEWVVVGHFPAFPDGWYILNNSVNTPVIVREGELYDHNGDKQELEPGDVLFRIVKPQELIDWLVTGPLAPTSTERNWAKSLREHFPDVTA